MARVAAERGPCAFRRRLCRAHAGHGGVLRGRVPSRRRLLVLAGRVDGLWLDQYRLVCRRMGLAHDAEGMARAVHEAYRQPGQWRSIPTSRRAWTALRSGASRSASCRTGMPDWRICCKGCASCRASAWWRRARRSDAASPIPPSSEARLRCAGGAAFRGRARGGSARCRWRRGGGRGHPSRDRRPCGSRGGLRLRAHPKAHRSVRVALTRCGRREGRAGARRRPCEGRAIARGPARRSAAPQKALRVGLCGFVRAQAAMRVAGGRHGGSAGGKLFAGAGDRLRFWRRGWRGFAPVRPDCVPRVPSGLRKRKAIGKLIR